jgi:hypothetical protein
VSPATTAILAFFFSIVFPLLAATGSFLVVLRRSVPAQVKQEKLRSSLSLVLSDEKVVWSIAEKELAWPAAELEWAVVAALAVMLSGLFALGGQLDLTSFWLTIATAALAISAPSCLRVFWPHGVRRRVQKELISSLSPQREEEAAIREIAALAGDIETCYSELGLRGRIRVMDRCRDIVIQRAMGETAGAVCKLVALRDSLADICSKLRPWIESQRQLWSEFGLVKNLVMDRGSVTLIGEVDRVKAAMTSGRLVGALDRGKWELANALVEQIAFDLKLIRNMAEGGSDIPQSLGEACRILSITKDTPKKTAKAVVDALRRVWHPDLSRNAEERELRTARCRQINVAWEIYLAAEKDASADEKSIGKRSPNSQQ